MRFTGTFGKCVFVRLDEPSRVELLTVAGAKPFEPMEDRPMKEYVHLPESFLNEPPKATACPRRRDAFWKGFRPRDGNRLELGGRRLNEETEPQDDDYNLA